MEAKKATPEAIMEAIIESFLRTQLGRFPFKPNQPRPLRRLRLVILLYNTRGTRINIAEDTYLYSRGHVLNTYLYSRGHVARESSPCREWWGWMGGLFITFHVICPHIVINREL